MPFPVGKQFIISHEGSPPPEQARTAAPRVRAHKPPQHWVARAISIFYRFDIKFTFCLRFFSPAALRAKFHQYSSDTPSCSWCHLNALKTLNRLFFWAQHWNLILNFDVLKAISQRCWVVVSTCRWIRPLWWHCSRWAQKRKKTHTRTHTRTHTHTPSSSGPHRKRVQQWSTFD